MSSSVPLCHISYHDSTGYATHVLIEVSQYINGKIQVASYSLPVDRGYAVLWKPGLAGVFRFEIQPVVGRTPSDRTPVTPPATFRSDGGLFVESAVVVTCGNLICTTDVLVAQTVPATIHRVEPLATPQQARGGYTFEADFSLFEYFDMADGDAASVLVTLHGMSAGEEGPWEEELKVVDGAALPLKYTYEDVTQLVFQPYTSSSPDPNETYGYPVTRTATPGFFLTSVIGRTTAGVNYPRNSATKTQTQPLPLPFPAPHGVEVAELAVDPIDEDDVLQPRPTSRVPKPKARARKERKGNDKPASSS